jgi:hypothetical protein
VAALDESEPRRNNNRQGRCQDAVTLYFRHVQVTMRSERGLRSVAEYLISERLHLSSVEARTVKHLKIRSLFTRNEIGAKGSKRDMIGASLTECTVSDTLPIDILESCERKIQT